MVCEQTPRDALTIKTALKILNEIGSMANEQEPSERGRQSSSVGARAPVAAMHAAAPILLTIAGFDPSSGAGFTADLKVFAAHGCYGVAAATALTVQSTAGVRRAEPVAAGLLGETLACLADDLPIAGVKIGMLATEANVEVVAGFLGGFRTPVVLDPVLRSTSGHPLLDVRGLEYLRAILLPLVTCITPNVAELLLLSGEIGHEPVDAERRGDRDEVEEAAAQLAQQFPGVGIVATGGHLGRPDDYVLVPGAAPVWMAGEWVQTRATHGTGCAYSSALLCGLVRGLTMIEAARAAKRYVTEALRAAVPMGQGGGSMDHLYAMHQSVVPVRLRESGS